jgi:perosamine synthetase
VIIPSFAFIALANTVLHVGAIPVFAEIDPITLNLDPTSVEQVITARTRAVIAVHTFGIPADMESLRSIATRHGLALIEDACEAIGAEIKGKRVGGFGDLAVLGFYPNKQITTGEGGAVLVRDTAYAERLRSLRNQGRSPGNWLDHREAGFNYRLSELECALGRVQLSRITEILGLRRAAAERYHALLQGVPGIELPPLEFEDRTVSWFVYVVRMSDMLGRDKLHAHLGDHGIASGRYFGPIHEQPSMQGHLGPTIDLTVTESIARSTLALPFFNRITLIQQEEVASEIGKFAESTDFVRT